MTFHAAVSAYDPCSGRALPGTKNLATAINDLYDRSYSLGIYNCRPSSGGGGMSIHSDGRAFDAGFPVTNGMAHPQGHQLLAVLRANAWGLGLQRIIWDRKSYSARYPNGIAYTGPSPHIDHLHIEQTPYWGQNLPLSTAYDLLSFEEMLTPEQEAVLNELVLVRRELGSLSSNFFAIPAAVKLIKALRRVDDVFDTEEF